MRLRNNIYDDKMINIFAKEIYELHNEDSLGGSRGKALWEDLRHITQLKYKCEAAFHIEIIKRVKIKNQTVKKETSLSSLFSSLKEFKSSMINLWSIIK